MRRRELDGCPVSGALQMLGDKWTLLVARDLALGPKRTMELLDGLFPISSRTLVGRLRDMEKDRLLTRTDFGGNPPHIEYELTDRGRLLLPLVDTLRDLGEALRCNECEDRFKRLGYYCDACPSNPDFGKEESSDYAISEPQPVPRPASTPRRERDDIVLL